MVSRKVPTSLGTEPIGRLLLKYALPSIIAMTAMSVYNVVDSIFVGHGVGAMALAGLGVTLPFMNITVAFSTLIGVGASNVLSVRIGQKDYPSAILILGNAVTMNIICSLAIMVVSLLFLDPILTFFGASAHTLPYAHDFMTVLLLGSVVSQLFFGLNAMLRSSGAPKKAMVAMIGTVLINLVLNPLFIFVLHLGIRGSALATVLSQGVMLCYQLHFFADSDRFIHFERQALRLRRRIVADSLSIGLSPFFLHIASCLIVILINNGLIRYGGDMSIGAYGIINRVSFVFGMIIIGLVQAMQPIAGYNYGAKRYDRVTRVLRLAILWATLVSTMSFVMGEFLPHQVSSLFTTDETLISQSVRGMRIVLLSGPIVGFQMIASSFFNCVGMARKAIFLTLTRQLLFIFPALLLLSHFYGLDGIWWSMPVSDVLSTLLAGGMLFLQWREFRKDSLQ